MPDVFDFVVLGGLGLVGLGAFATYKYSNQKIKEYKSLSRIQNNQFQEMKIRGSDQPRKVLLQHARVQPYDRRQMQLFFVGETTDKKENKGEPNQLQKYSEYSSKDFGRLTFPAQFNYPTKFRLQVRNTKIQNSLITKQKGFFGGTSYTFSRLAPLTIIGAIGYDYENQQFYVTSFTITKSLKQLLDEYQLMKTVGIGLAVVGVVVAAGLLIFKNAIVRDQNNRPREQRRL